MKKITFALFAFVAVFIFASCDDTETYADKKKKETAAINQFIADSAINVISEEQFYAQDSTTDVSKNQYVLMASDGVYMQIVRKGCGSKLKSGDAASVIARFSERNLLTDSLQLSNNINYYATIPDIFNVRKYSSTFYASFVSGLMNTAYGSSVPQGWLVPLNFVNLGRQTDADSEIAKLKLIVPAAEGQAYASANVYPCFYELTFERGR